MLQRLEQKRRELARELADLERAQRVVAGEELMSSWDPAEAMLAMVLQGEGGSRAFKRARVGAGGNSAATTTTVGWSAAGGGGGGGGDGSGGRGGDGRRGRRGERQRPGSPSEWKKRTCGR